MMTPARDLRRPLAALLVLTAVACASGPAPRDHFYRVEVATPPALPSPLLAGTLEVDRLRVEAISEGRSMLYRQTNSSGEILKHSYHHWTEPPGVMLQDLLAQYLRAAGVAREVVTPAVRVESDYLLAGRIARLERVLGGGARVAVEVELTLTHLKERELLLHQTYREERMASGDDVAAAVDAYGAAVGAIFERFVADIPRS